MVSYLIYFYSFYTQTHVNNLFYEYVYHLLHLEHDKYSTSYTYYEATSAHTHTCTQRVLSFSTPLVVMCITRHGCESSEVECRPRGGGGAMGLSEPCCLPARGRQPPPQDNLRRQ